MRRARDEGGLRDRGGAARYFPPPPSLRSHDPYLAVDRTASGPQCTRETITLNGQRQYILAVIEHTTRRIRVLGTTAHPSPNWVIQAIKNLVTDLNDAGCQAHYLFRDRDESSRSL
jgi:hypothetical protein